MSPALISAALWVVVATGVALMPMRYQFRPGLILLIAAPVIIVWIGAMHGWLWAALGLAGFLSMFRRPLWYLSRKALGKT